MGVVLRALDRRLNRPVAIKRVLGEMARSKKALSRFLTEAQAIASLNHFNIVQIYDYGHDAEGPFIIMELVEGESLQEKLREGPLELATAVKLTCQLCDGLAVAHEQGIVHRDIKPANILLTGRGEPKLTDFGLARQETAGHGQTQAGAILGTIDFMPPEQQRDATATDGRSDLWSLAATLYQMVTGKSPKIIKFRNVPQALQDVLEKALEDAPQDRYQTTREFRAALQSSLAATAEPVAEVAVDLGAGECDQCHTRNESNRKFCRECAAPLRLSCLTCELEIPVWEKVCGECGGKQAELLAAHRNKLSGIIESSLTLSREHEYEKALAQLKIVTEDKHASKESYQQAAKQSELVTARRDEQYELRDQLVKLAKQYQQGRDYEAVVRELEKIPAPLRTGNKIAQQLSIAQAALDKLTSLEEEIRGYIKTKQIDRLLKKTTRFVELTPGHEKIQKLHEQLLQQQQKAAAKKAARVAISAALEKKDWRRVLQLDPTNREALWLNETAFKGHTDIVSSVAFSPYGMLIVSGSHDDTLKIWDANSGEEQRTLNGHGDFVTSVAFSPDGKRIASGSADKTVIIWDANSGEELQTLRGHPRSVSSVAFSPDGKRIVSGSHDDTLKIWDANSGEELRTLNGHGDFVTSVAFSPDGKRIVSGSSDKTVKVWDASSGKELQTLEGHTDFVTSVAFSPDGKRIVSGSGDKTVKVWEVSGLTP